MKVGIVGCGCVGATAGYAMVMCRVGREIVLVDKNPDRANAEADDIQHAVPFAHPLTVRSGGYRDLPGCRVVLLCAGVGQKPGESRLQLLQRNAQIFREIVPQALENALDAVLVVATNPVDVMTHLTVRFTDKLGVPAGRVFGSETTLDTARFRGLLGQHCGVDPHHVHAYVIPDENRMVGHYWLRNPGLTPTPEIAAKIRNGIADVKTFAARVHDGTQRPIKAPRFTRVLSIGIGGSALGPMFVADALGDPATDRMQIEFIDNTDPDGIARTLHRSDRSLQETLCIVTSKSGATPETRNASDCRGTCALIRQFSGGSEGPRDDVWNGNQQRTPKSLTRGDQCRLQALR